MDICVQPIACEGCGSYRFEWDESRWCMNCGEEMVMGDHEWTGKLLDRKYPPRELKPIPDSIKGEFWGRPHGSKEK